jgi:hypothetical protein
MPTEPRFALVGDCNAGIIGRVARTRGVGFVGGPIDNGHALEQDFFDLDGTTFVPRSQKRAPELHADLFRCGLPILSTVGSNIHRIAIDLNRAFYFPHRLDQRALSDAVLRQVIVENRPGPLRFYRTAEELGCEVHVVHSSQRFPDGIAVLARRLEAVFLDLVACTGAALVDVRAETTDDAGDLRPEYFTEREDDLTHANAAWAELVLDKFLRAAKVPARLSD